MVKNVSGMDNFILNAGMIALLPVGWLIMCSSNRLLLFFIYLAALVINVLLYFRLSADRIKKAAFKVGMLILPLAIVSFRVFFIPTFSVEDASPGGDFFGGSREISPPFAEAGKYLTFPTPVHVPKIEVIGDWSEEITVKGGSEDSVEKGTWVTRYPWGETTSTPGSLHTYEKKARVYFLLAKNSHEAGTARFILRKALNNEFVKEYQFRIHKNAWKGNTLYGIGFCIYLIASFWSYFALGQSLGLLFWESYRLEKYDLWEG